LNNQIRAIHAIDSEMESLISSDKKEEAEKEKEIDNKESKEEVEKEPETKQGENMESIKIVTEEKKADKP
jgi:uncharacterized protein with von Willebrand factor type A (vWA) domain